MQGNLQRRRAATTTIRAQVLLYTQRVRHTRTAQWYWIYCTYCRSKLGALRNHGGRLERHWILTSRRSAILPDLTSSTMRTPEMGTHAIVSVLLQHVRAAFNL